MVERHKLANKKLGNLIKLFSKQKTIQKQKL